jgi:hypothetical protein
MRLVAWLSRMLAMPCVAVSLEFRTWLRYPHYPRRGTLNQLRHATTPCLFTETGARQRLGPHELEQIGVCQSRMAGQQGQAVKK